MTSEQCEAILVELRLIREALDKLGAPVKKVTIPIDVSNFPAFRGDVEPGTETPENSAVNTPRKRSSKKCE